jgi:hypothetical protein
VLEAAHLQFADLEDAEQAQVARREELVARPPRLGGSAELKKTGSAACPSASSSA